MNFPRRLFCKVFINQLTYIIFHQGFSSYQSYYWFLQSFETGKKHLNQLGGILSTSDPQWIMTRDTQCSTLCTWNGRQWVKVFTRLLETTQGRGGGRGSAQQQQPGWEEAAPCVCSGTSPMKTESWQAGIKCSDSMEWRYTPHPGSQPLLALWIARNHR